MSNARFVEALESRRLLSAALASGVLTVNGTSNNDLITVGLTAADGKLRVTDNGTNRDFDLADVSLIKVFGRSGADRLEVSQFHGALTIEVRLSGESGNDTLVGGSGNDKLWGGDGDDQMTGVRGDDALNAGNGNDLIDAGDGQDTVWGGAGDDSINGGDGDDYLAGRDGMDTILGGNGVDTIFGDNGEDNLNGGAGFDDIRGGLGLDIFSEVDAQAEKTDFGLI